MELGLRLRLLSLIHKTFGSSWQCGGEAVWQCGEEEVVVLKFCGSGAAGEDEDDTWHANMGSKLPSDFLVDFGARTLHRRCHFFLLVQD